MKFWKGDNITSMTGNNIFVYGANPEFRNGFGAAKVARDFGALPYGSGRGIVGNTYGLITKNLKAGYVEKATGIVYEKAGEKSISLEMISNNVHELYQCAINNPDKKFFIAYKVDNKNLNGYTAKEMWDVFTHNKIVPENIRFHDSFRCFLNQKNTITKDNSISPNENNIQKENFTFFFYSPSPFSQWHPSIFKVKDITFTSAEQFMMYCKSKLFKDEIVAQNIINLNNEGILAQFLSGEIKKEDIFKNKDLFEAWNKKQKQIKDLGKEVSGFIEEAWVQHRVSYVAKGNYEKFTQNLDIKEILLKTNDSIMVEASPYDKIWGIGLKSSDPDVKYPERWKGLNLLGKVLTELKDKLKQEISLNNNQVKNKSKYRP